MQRSPKREPLVPLAIALGGVLLLSAAGSVAGGLQVPQPVAAGGRTTAATPLVGPIGMTVDDMDRSVAFYTTVLSFAKVSDERIDSGPLATLSGVEGGRRIVRLRLGDELLDLTDYLDPGGPAIPEDSRSQDQWFQHVAIIVRNMDQAHARLRQHGVDRISPAPQRLPDWNPAAGGIRAFYFRDPDRHVLEILAFPPGKGLPKWHQPGPALFLGIDHTAIVVEDTGKSLDFYGGRLGLGLAGTSENHGPEQERLNDVPGARLRITTLRGTAGPGVEFLHYLSPQDGRRRPSAWRADALAHWETTIAAAGLRQLVDRWRDGTLFFVSPGIVRLPGGDGALVRDPDGHAVKLVERTS